MEILSAGRPRSKSESALRSALFGAVATVVPMIPFQLTSAAVVLFAGGLCGVLVAIAPPGTGSHLGWSSKLALGLYCLLMVMAHTIFFTAYFADGIDVPWATQLRFAWRFFGMPTSSLPYLLGGSFGQFFSFAVAPVNTVFLGLAIGSLQRWRVRRL